MARGISLSLARTQPLGIGSKNHPNTQSATNGECLRCGAGWQPVGNLRGGWLPPPGRLPIGRSLPSCPTRCACQSSLSPPPPRDASLKCAGEITNRTAQSGLCLDRHATHGAGPAHHQRGGPTGGGGGRARDPGDRARRGRDRAGRLFYLGAGPSGPLGVLDPSEIPPTFSAPPEMVQGIMAGGEAALSRATETTEDDPAIGVRDLSARGFTAKDVLVGIAASGRTPYVLGAVAEARRLGAVTVGICCTPHAELSGAVDFAIVPLVGPEIVAGSTRMKAGTAQKLVLNMLSTAAFIRLGYVYGNLMVNVQPKNEKLVDRARRIVARAAGVTTERARELLAESGMSVRAAIVMGKAGIARDEAERRLVASRGRVRQALGEVRQGFPG